ncbi:MAG: hypothetical protein IH875_11095 [Candidatus Dadabacteria bacterium]|nr:hypothetical protein [Candidatus Dadabacteria bacterium]
MVRKRQIEYKDREEATERLLEDYRFVFPLGNKIIGFDIRYIPHVEGDLDALPLGKLELHLGTLTL